MVTFELSNTSVDVKRFFESLEGKTEQYVTFSRPLLDYRKR